MKKINWLKASAWCIGLFLLGIYINGCSKKYKAEKEHQTIDAKKAYRITIKRAMNMARK